MNAPDALARAGKGLRDVLAPPPSVEDRNIRNLYIDTAWQGVWSAGMGTFLAVFMARLDASSFLISALTSIPALITIVLSIPAAAYVERQRDHVRTTTIYRLLFRGTYLAVAVSALLHDEGAAARHRHSCGRCRPSRPRSVNLSWTSVIGAVIPPRRRPTVNGGRWALVSVVVAVAVIPFGKLLDARWLTFPLNYQLVFFISTSPW